MKKIIFTLISIVFITSTVQSQINLLNEAPEQFQKSINQSSQNSNFRSGSLEAALTEAFDNVVMDSEITGFNAAMMLPDGTIWKGTSGIAIGDMIPVTMSTEHLMGMGSITKSFVAATLLMMAEDEMLSLDDSIGMYLPSYPNISGAATVRQLLSHRTGFNDYLNENPNTVNTWASQLNNIWTIDDMLNDFVLEPNFEVDDSWSYSNTNYLLAGLVIESIAGGPWYLVVRNRIIDPLGLTNTFAHPFESYGSQPFAHAFTDLTGNGEVQDMQLNGYPLDGFFSMASSAGNLLSTPEDLVKFTTALHGGDLLSPESLDEMYVNHSPGVGIHYGLGVYQSNANATEITWGHNGSIIYQSLAQYVPGKNISIAVQQNDARTDFGPDSYIDHTDVFLALFDAYCNYDPVSNTNIEDNFTNIYPNPNNGDFVIEVLENTSVEIINLTGKVVGEMNVNAGTNQIELKDVLNPGIYFLKVGAAVEKVVVE